MDFAIQTIIELLIIGFVAGVLGGMSGLGGSIVMIPTLAILLGPNQHLYQAAAMIVNVLVAMTATLRHWRAKAIRWDVALRMLPVGLLMILFGVAVSDRFEAEAMQQVFGVFLLYIVLSDLLRLSQSNGETQPEEPRTGWATSSFVCAIMGFTSGLLGIGGGGLAVPLLQRVCYLPMRQSIATSSAVMCITAILGAALKNLTLGQHDNLQNMPAKLALADSLLIAAYLAPTAILGGFIGAILTHALPIRYVQIAFMLLLSLGSLKMLGLI